MGKGYGGWLKLNRERKKENDRKKESNTCMMTQVRSPTSFSLLSNGPQQLDWLSLCHYIKLWVRTCRLSDIS
jgi:hypothetical protein